MKRAILLVLLLLLPVTPNFGMTEDIGDLFGAIARRYDLDFRIHIDGSFFPKYWQNPPISVKAREISLQELRRFPPIIEQALARYPQQLIKDNLTGIYIIKDLYCYGVRYGATYSNSIIYLSSEGSEKGYGDYYLLSTVHHEFSSILFNNYLFPHARWIASSPGGAHYRYALQGGYKALIDGSSSLEGNDALYSAGFVNEYASSHMEEDFSEFSAFVLTYPLMMRELIKKYPAMKNKFHVWLEFYESLDKAFMRERSLLE
ncbi:MAG: hypothetical protein JXA20_16255 [Spirochaetes bacterium]|nr:hypothetical protein [Spirochaetota bacterium]